MNCTVISVERELVTRYVVERLEIIYDGYIVRVNQELQAVKLLGSNVYVIKVRMRSYVQTLYCSIINYLGRTFRISKKRSRNKNIYCNFLIYNCYRESKFMLLLTWQNGCGLAVLVLFDDTIVNIATALYADDLGA